MWLIGHILKGTQQEASLCTTALFVGDLAKAVRNQSDLRFGLYHSLYEWFHPLFVKDKANNFETTKFVQVGCTPVPSS